MTKIIDLEEEINRKRINFYTERDNFYGNNQEWYEPDDEPEEKDAEIIDLNKKREEHKMDTNQKFFKYVSMIFKEAKENYVPQPVLDEVDSIDIKDLCQNGGPFDFNKIRF